MRIAVLMARRRIVVACAKILADDTGGIFWADIPPSRFSPSDPPRGPYVWKQAKIADIPRCLFHKFTTSNAVDRL
jgi:hypothetical protein